MDSLVNGLKLWLDPVLRSGPENMAVDDWLLESMDCSILRIYGWAGKWGSLGRFCSLNQALEINSSVCWVRRPTGGGVVDHQSDWTYTLVIPETERLADIPPGESYRIIHEKLTKALNGRFKLIDSDPNDLKVGGICFEYPVRFDVVNDDGNKIAGAGQRRTKRGLLHQGSVAGMCNSIESIDRSKRFSAELNSSYEEVSLEPPHEIIRLKIEERYGNDRWTRRR